MIGRAKTWYLAEKFGRGLKEDSHLNRSMFSAVQKRLRGIGLRTARRERSALLLRSLNLSAALVRVFALLPTARFAPVFSQPSNIHCVMSCAMAPHGQRSSTSSNRS